MRNKQLNNNQEKLKNKLEKKYNFYTKKSVSLCESLEEVIINRKNCINNSDLKTAYNLGLELIVVKTKLKKYWDIQIDLFFKLKEVNNG